MKITVKELRQIIKEEISKLSEARVINFKNGVTAKVGDTVATLSHPKYGNQTFKFLPNYDRYKIKQHPYELEFQELVNRFAKGELGKGEKPFKQITKTDKPAAEKPALLKPEAKFKETNYKNGVKEKMSTTTQDLWLTHPKRKPLKAKWSDRYNRYRPEGSSDEYSKMELIKAYADGKIK